MRSILMIPVFSLNPFMFYQPVVAVCLSMRCGWGKEVRIGDAKGRFFEHVHRYMKITISTVIRSSVDVLFIKNHANSRSPSLSSGHLVDGVLPA